MYSFKTNICIICADYDADIISGMDVELLNFHYIRNAAAEYL